MVGAGDEGGQHGVLLFGQLWLNSWNTERESEGESKRGRARKTIREREWGKMREIRQQREGEREHKDSNVCGADYWSS